MQMSFPDSNFDVWSFKHALGKEVFGENRMPLDIYRSRYGLYTIIVYTRNCYKDVGRVRDYLKSQGFGLMTIEDDRLICFEKDIQNLVTLWKMKGVL